MAKNKPLIITIISVLALALLVGATSSSAPKGLSRSVTAVGGIFVPLESFFYDLSNRLLAGSEPEGTDTSTVADTAEYEVRLMDYGELKAENERLKSMLSYKEAQQDKQLKMARVTGKDPGNWFEVFTIDAGSNDGIEVDMAVVTPDGLVGRIEEVGLSWSKVMTVIDSRSRVPIIVERTRDVGVVGGPLSAAPVKQLTMNYLPLDSDVAAGDTVVTSGLGDVFPRGIPVGAVASTKQDNPDSSIAVEPFVNFRSILEVFIVLNSKDTTTVINDDIADHNAVISNTTVENNTNSGEQNNPEVSSPQDEASTVQAEDDPQNNGQAAPTPNNADTEVIIGTPQNNAGNTG